MNNLLTYISGLLELSYREPFVLAIAITVLILTAISFGIAIYSYKILLILPYFIERCCGDRNQSTAYSDEIPELHNTNSVLENDMPPKYEDIELQTVFSSTHYSLFNLVGNSEYPPHYSDIHK